MSPSSFYSVNNGFQAVSNLDLRACSRTKCIGLQLWLSYKQLWASSSGNKRRGANGPQSSVLSQHIKCTVFSWV